MIPSFFLKSKPPTWERQYLINKEHGTWLMELSSPERSPELPGWSNPSGGRSPNPHSKQAIWSLLSPWCSRAILTLTLDGQLCRSSSPAGAGGLQELSSSRAGHHTPHAQFLRQPFSKVLACQGSMSKSVCISALWGCKPLYFWSPGVLPVSLQGEQTLGR